MVPGERAAGSAYSFGASGHEGGAPPRPHSSGFRTFLNWFRRAEVTRRGAATGAGAGDAAPRPRTPEPDSDDGSTDSETSTATAASFAFLPPAGYRPYGDALAPHKYIASGPYTDTYRRRVAERERRRRLDTGVTLRKKYQLPGGDATLAPLREAHSPDPLDYDTFSLPAMSRRAHAAAPEHRRAASETKFVRPASYVHVKGKRRAPPPPAPAAAAAAPLSATLTRRVKRLAPRPPATASDPEPTKFPSPPASPEPARAAASESSERQAAPSAPLPCEQPLPGDAATVENSVQPTAPPLTKSWLATSQTKADPPAHGEPSSPLAQRVREANKPLLLHSKSEESWKPPATTRETGELSPRPWYKRQFSDNKTKTKSEEHKQRSKPDLPEIGFFRYSKLFDGKRNSTSPKSEEKRFSHALPNISELDREAAEILQMHKKSTLEENNNNGNDVNAAPSFANPRSARLLISKFNELNKGKTGKDGDVKNQGESRPTFQQKISQVTAPVEAMKETDNMQSQAVSQEGKFKSGDDTWVCMRCEKRNNCKKIICSSCFSRKPKDDDDLFAKHIKKDLLKSFESEVLDALSHLGNMTKNDIDDSKHLDEPKEAAVPLELDKQAKDKMEEQKKLRQILKEMKDSLPKESKESIENSGSNKPSGNAGPSGSKVSVKGEDPNPSNQKVIVVDVLTKKDSNTVTNSSAITKIGGDNKNEEKTTKKEEFSKTSSFAQTQINPINSVTVNTNLPPSNNIEDSLYANVRVPIPTTKSQNPATGMAKSAKLLLKELEAAIGRGDDQAAAELAKRLAQMKVNCTVVSSTATLAKPQDDDDVDVEVYVEDAQSAAGPVRLRVRRAATLPQLRAAAARQLGVPPPLQRWIVGRQLCVGDAPLADYNGGDFALPLFLYVVSPAKVEGDVKSDVKVTTENAEKTAKPENAMSSVSASEAANSATAKPSANSKNTSNNVTNSSTNVEVGNNPLTEPSKNSKDASKIPTSSNPLEFTTNPSAGSTNSKDASENPSSLNVSDVSKSPTTQPTTSSKTTGIKATESSASVTKPPSSEGPAAGHYQQLVQLESQELIPNAEQFACGVCLEPCAVGAGATLRECLHTFCRECLADTVRHCDAAQVVCPYRDAQYSCESALQHREVRALVSAAEYERRLARSVQLAERGARDAFHCKTADCAGWCVYENAVNEFRCPVCRRTNCLTCQVIHMGENCAEYQGRIRREAEGAGSGAAEAERTRRALEEMCARGDALACPTCQVVLMKKWGCDWVRCSMCRTEICWVTRGARWGPAGRGDTSAGCRCGVGGVKCHPACNYCH